MGVHRRTKSVGPLVGYIQREAKIKFRLDQIGKLVETWVLLGKLIHLGPCAGKPLLIDQLVEDLGLPLDRLV